MDSNNSVSKKNKFSYKKSRSLPAKANKEKQEEFLNNTLKPLLNKASSEDNTKVYFGDAVHIIYGASLGYCWCCERQLIPSAYGRKRFNVLGALDSVTNETITISNDTYITSVQVVEMLRKLREINGDKEVYFILDNARYQKCELVEKASKKYNINIVYLPSYSPNLNLIERLWKFLRSKCLNNKYYLTFDLFGNSIIDCLSRTHTDYKTDLSTLLSLKFEIF